MCTNWKPYLLLALIDTDGHFSFILHWQVNITTWYISPTNTKQVLKVISDWQLLWTKIIRHYNITNSWNELLKAKFAKPLIIFSFIFYFPKWLQFHSSAEEKNPQKYTLPVNYLIFSISSFVWKRNLITVGEGKTAVGSTRKSNRGSPGQHNCSCLNIRNLRKKNIDKSIQIHFTCIRQYLFLLITF